MASIIKADEWQNTAGVKYGTVLQVVQAAKTDTFSAANTGSWIDIPGLSVNITPTSATSKFLISVNIGMVHTFLGGRDRTTSFRVFRNGVDTLLGDAAGSRQRALFRNGSSETDGNHGYGACFTFVDSPSTTALITYKVSLDPENGSTVVINRTFTNDDVNDAYGSRVPSTIVVMEIAA